MLLATCFAAPTHINEALTDLTLRQPVRGLNTSNKITMLHSEFSFYVAVTFRQAFDGKWGCFVFPVSCVPRLMITSEWKAGGEGWGQYASNGCTFWCLTCSTEWLGDAHYPSPPSFSPSLSPHISHHVCPPPTPAFSLSYLSMPFTTIPPHHYPLPLHLPSGSPLLLPPPQNASLPEYEIYEICFPPPSFRSGTRGVQSADVLVSG